jgi:hypothetical protein
VQALLKPIHHNWIMHLFPSSSMHFSLCDSAQREQLQWCLTELSILVLKIKRWVQEILPIYFARTNAISARRALWSYLEQLGGSGYLQVQYLLKQKDLLAENCFL